MAKMTDRGLSIALWAAIALGAIAVVGLATSAVDSYDLFWQLQSGRYMAETGTFIRQDLFSLAASVPRYEHCWLHDLIFYSAFKFGGYPGVVTLRCILVGALVPLVFWVNRVRGGSLLSGVILGVPLILLTAPFWSDRPQLWTYLLAVVFILVLEKRARFSFSSVCLLSALMILWANLHGGAILAFPLVVAYLVGDVVATSGEKRPQWLSDYGKKLLLLLVGLLLASFVTPYGSMPVKTLLAFSSPVYGAGLGGSSPVAHNLDWQATRFADNSVFFLVLVVAALLLAAVRRNTRIKDVLLLGGLAFMGWKLNRHTPFFLLAGAAILPVYLDDAGALLGRKIAWLRPSLFWKFLCLVGTVALVLWILTAFSVYRPPFRPRLQTWQFPVQAAEFVKRHNLPATLFNSYDWGGYLMWTLFPSYQVFWDGRQSSQEHDAAGVVIEYGGAGWDQLLEKYGVGTAIVKPCAVDNGARFRLIDKMIESQKWRLVFADDVAIVFVDKDKVDAKWLQKYQLEKDLAFDTILSQAKYLTKENPRRNIAYWEMARIYYYRKQYRESYNSLIEYFSRTNTEQRIPLAIEYYKNLNPIYGGGVGR